MTAIAIGTGGPFGAEGPIIQTGGAFASLVGQLISTTAAEREVLLACGAGAGMAATFNTPIAGVILAIELLLFEFRSRSFIPLYRMLQNNIGWLPVVSRGDPHVLFGYLSRGSVLGAWTRQFEEEFQREHGWLKQLLRAGTDKPA